MASAEGRARWLHYANHCIIQEDYKPPSSSKPRSEQSPVDDTKWWLHPQPKDTAASLWEPSWESLNIEDFAKIKELEAVIGDTSQKKPTQDDYLLISEKSEKLLSEIESQLIKSNKTEPWWRTADLNDLASFVSDKSVERFDNCDLPRTQINKSGQWFAPDKGLASLDQVSNFADSMPRSPTSVSVSQPHGPSGAAKCVRCGLDVPLSSTASGEVENMQANSELSKAELLEALCHSQTRARQAEEAAKKACDEKEDMISHFLKQASQLFAYKQWFHMLQLETSLRNRKYQPIHTCFPDFGPWIPIKGKQQKKGRSKPGKTSLAHRASLLGAFFWVLVCCLVGPWVGYLDEL
ncbi:hypothetical protein OSB04_017104, partial [Centaurea solstitialis]